MLKMHQFAAKLAYFGPKKAKNRHFYTHFKLFPGPRPVVSGPVPRHRGLAPRPSKGLALGL